MSDNVAVTAGVGTSIATDDCGSIQVQRVKLAFGGVGILDDEILTSASINASSSGNNTLVAAVAGQTVRVYALFLVVAGTVGIKFNGGSDLTGVMTFGAGGGMVLDRMGVPWFTSTVANGFILNLSAAVQVSGRIYYAQSA